MPNAQIGLIPLLYVNGLQLSNNATTPNTKLDVAAGQARCGDTDSANLVDIILEDAVTLDTAVVGANGIDTGALAASTWYCVYLIGSSTNSAAAAVILSTSATGPQMPQYYDVWKRIGWAKTDSSVHFLAFYMVGNGNERKVTWNLDTTSSALLVSGAATSFTAVSALANFVPATSRTAEFTYDFLPGAAGRTATFRPTGGGIAAGNCVELITGQVTSVHVTGKYVMQTGSAQTIDYVVSNAGDALTLYAKAYIDFI